MCHGKICSTASASRAEGTFAAVANDLIQTATNEPDFLKKFITLKGTEVSLSCVQCFLHLISSSVMSLFHMRDVTGYFLERTPLPRHTHTLGEMRYRCT